MKLTNQHVSDEDLNKLIDRVRIAWSKWDDWLFVYALLELKQRRAEDRQRENDRKTD